MTSEEENQPMTCPPPQTLADLRRAAGLSQAKVAERMGVGTTRVGLIEARYPNLNYSTVTSYITAIGGHIAFSGIGPHSVDARADQLIADPARERTRNYLLETASKEGALRINRELGRSAPEELPLQGETPEPGSDDTGREVDQPDAERDQGDESHGQ